MANKTYRKLRRKLNHIVRNFNEELAQEYGGDIKIYQIESFWNGAYKDYLFCVMKIKDSSTGKYHEFYIDTIAEKFAPKIKRCIDDFIRFDRIWRGGFDAENEYIVPKNYKRRN